MLDVNIANGTGRRNKASVSQDGFLRVDTKPYYEYRNAVRYFVSDEYGRTMNVNASPSATTTENIHDGEDNTYWTASIINGAISDFDFNSTDQSYSGAQSFQYNAEDGEVAQFLNPGGLIDLSSYTSLSGYIYLTTWDQIDTKEILFYGYNTNTGLTVGNSVNLGDYINTTDLNAWQPFTITFNALGLAGQSIDAIRTQVVDTGGGTSPKGYLDNFRLEGLQAGTVSPVRYRLKPNTGEYLIVESLNFIFVKEYDSSIANGTMYGLSYDDILGYTPTNGILYRRFSKEVLEFNVLLKNIFDLLSIPDMTITDVCYDGTNTLLKIKYSFVEKAILKYSFRDYIELRLSDNFSDFKEFRVSAGCKVREEEYEQPLI